MQDGDVILEGEYVYVKWGDRGVCLLAQTDEKKKHITVDRIHRWDFPKQNPMKKTTRIEIKAAVAEYLKELGYSSEFEYYED